MQCSEIREMLSAYIDQVLDEQETAQIEQHLRSCSACLQEFSELQETVTLLRSLGDVSPPEDFRARLRERLEQEPLPGRIVGMPGHKSGFMQWVRTSRKYLAAAAVILGVGISAGVYSLNQMKAGSSAPEVALNQSSSSESAKSKTMQPGTSGRAKDKQDDTSKGRGTAEDIKSADGSGGGTDGTTGPKFYSSQEASGPRQEKSLSTRRSDTSAGKDHLVTAARIPQTAGSAGESPDGSGGISTGGQPAGQNAGDAPAGQETKAAGINNSVAQSPETFNALGAPAAAPPGTGGADMGLSLQENGTESAANEQNTARKASEGQAGGERSTGTQNAADEKDATYIAEGPAPGTAPAETGQADKHPRSAEGDAAKLLKTSRAVVKDGVLSLEVADYREFSHKLTSLIEQSRGFVENSSEKTEVPVSATFIIRVPSGRFTELLDRTAVLGRVTGKQVIGRDASDQVVDIKARLAGLQKQEQRLLELVDKAKSADEMAGLKSELDRVRTEIETLQGTLRNIDDTAAYSIVRLEVRQTAVPGKGPAQDAFSKAATNFKESATGMAKFLGGMVAFIGLILPWVLVLGVLGGALYYIWKKYQGGGR